jgi:dTMP kinase
MPRGWFITFEGGEGTGKSTQIEMLAGHLRERGLTVVVTREPGGTPVAEAVRAVLLDPSLEPDGLTELFLLEAARRDHVERVIRPAVERGHVVLSDRYTDSSTVYQGMVRGVGVERTMELNRIATGGLVPDVTVVLDFDHESGLRRARSRNAVGDGSESRLDDEPSAFHGRVREGFLHLAEEDPERVRVVSAEGPPEEVFARILAAAPEDLR